MGLKHIRVIPTLFRISAWSTFLSPAFATLSKARRCLCVHPAIHFNTAILLRNKRVHCSRSFTALRSRDKQTQLSPRTARRSVLAMFRLMGNFRLLIVQRQMG